MSNTGDQQSPAEGPKKYPCRQCGQPFDAYPPDDLHKTARLTPYERGDSVPQNYECENCHEMNTLHWDGVHVWVKSLGPRRVHYSDE
jgi:rubredoxin